MLICLVYHLCAASAFTLIHNIIENMDQQGTLFPTSKVMVCGNIHQLKTNDIGEQLNLTQVVYFPPHGPNTLDLILTDLTHLNLPP